MHCAVVTIAVAVAVTVAVAAARPPSMRVCARALDGRPWQRPMRVRRRRRIFLAAADYWKARRRRHLRIRCIQCAGKTFPDHDVCCVVFGVRGPENYLARPNIGRVACARGAHRRKPSGQ